MSNNLKKHIVADKVKWIAIFVIALALIGAVTTLFVKLDRQTTVTEIGAEAYVIGGLDENGEALEGNDSIVTRSAFTTDGLKVTVAKDAAVTYALNFYDADGKFVSADPAQAPAGHVESLGHAVQFDGDLLRAGNGEDAQGFSGKVQRRVSGIADDEDLIFLRELHNLLEELVRGRRAGRVVRIVQIKKLRASALLLRDGVEIGQKTVLLKQRQLDHASAKVFGPCPEHGIAGNRNQRDVAGVDEAGGQKRERGFASDRVADFTVGIKLDTVKRLHVARRGLPEFGDAVVRIGAVLPFRGFLAELAHDGRKRHVVGFSDTHVNDLNARVFRHGLAFCALDFFEFVDFRVLAEHVSADSSGKIVLKKAFRHCNFLLMVVH